MIDFRMYLMGRLKFHTMLVEVGTVVFPLWKTLAYVVALFNNAIGADLAEVKHSVTLNNSGFSSSGIRF